MITGNHAINGLRMADGRLARAVIFDVYHTLLHVDPGPVDAAEQWEQFCRTTVIPAVAGLSLTTGASAEGEPADLAGPGREAGQVFAYDFPTLAAFGAACRREIVFDHTAKKAAGIRWPEVDWRDITRRAWPALAALTEAELEAFLAAHAALERRCSAMPGALEFLENVRRSGAVAGIASNAQSYTLHELRAAGIAVERWFGERLCFWSWREGFSKPDSGAFRLLSARLADCGISPEETLMIGDRLDNDILPAKSAGWLTWHFQGRWPAAAGGS